MLDQARSSAAPPAPQTAQPAPAAARPAALAGPVPAPGDLLARSLAGAVRERAGAALLARQITVRGGVVTAQNWATVADKLEGQLGVYCGIEGIHDSRKIEAMLAELKAWAEEPADHDYSVGLPRALFNDVRASVDAREAAAAAAAAQAQVVAAPALTLEGAAATYGYTLTVTPGAKIRNALAEADFVKWYLPSTMTIQEAVDEAIDSYALSKSTMPRYARHDFQPAPAGVENIQVQLGGSAGNFHKGDGDTSSTLVVIDTPVWEKIPDGARREILALAHRRSFTGGSKVELRVPPKPVEEKKKKAPTRRK